MTRATVASWLLHGTSANVEQFATEVARELLAKEEAERIAKREANGPSALKVIEDARSGDPAAKSLIQKLTKKAPTNTPTEES